jgi:hypothetical protein
MWQNSIPLSFIQSSGPKTAGSENEIIFPTTVNVLLAPANITASPTNNINLPETFLMYIVSLLMLWTVILFPWVLLQTFLDHTTELYKRNFSPVENMITSFIKRTPIIKNFNSHASSTVSGANNFVVKKNLIVPKTSQNIDSKNS